MSQAKEHDAHRVWLAYSMSEVGGAIGAGALPLVAVLVLQAGPMQVATLAALSGVAAALLALPIGPWVEYWRKRPVMITADLIRAVALISVPLVAFLGALTMTQLYVVGALHGIGTILFPAASGAHLKGLVYKERRTYWLARNEATSWTTQSFGPPLGGALITGFGATATLVIDAITYALSALTLTTLRTKEPVPPTQAPDHHWLRDITTGWQYLLRSRELAPLFWNSLLFGGGIMLASPLMSIFYLRDLGLAPWQYGIALGVPCLGGLLGSLFAPRATTRFGDRATLLGAGVARTLWTGALPLAPVGVPGLVTVVVANTALLFSAGVFNPTFAAWRMANTADSHMTRVLTAWSVSSRTIQQLAMVLGGALAAVTSIRTALVVSAVLVLCSVALLPWRTRKRRPVPCAYAASVSRTLLTVGVLGVSGIEV